MPKNNCSACAKTLETLRRTIKHVKGSKIDLKTSCKSAPGCYLLAIERRNNMFQGALNKIIWLLQSFSCVSHWHKNYTLHPSFSRKERLLTFKKFTSMTLREGPLVYGLITRLSIKSSSRYNLAWWSSVNYRSLPNTEHDRFVHMDQLALYLSSWGDILSKKKGLNDEAKRF